MAYKKGEDRRQRTLFPDCIDDYVEQDSPVRLMDVFVDHLDMEGLGFQRFVRSLQWIFSENSTR